MEEMFHAVVACGVEGKVTDYRSDVGHIGADHKACCDRHEPAKRGFLGKTGTET